MDLRRIAFLLLGDLLTLALVTTFGFATHGELSTAGLRMLTTFIPLSIAWVLVSPQLGAYDIKLTQEARHLWRPAWAAILAGPMAAWLRGIWLGTPILPVFVTVLTGVTAVAIFAWRVIYWLILSRTS